MDVWWLQEAGGSVMVGRGCVESWKKGSLFGARSVCHVIGCVGSQEILAGERKDEERGIGGTPGWREWEWSLMGSCCLEGRSGTTSFLLPCLSASVKTCLI